VLRRLNATAAVAHPDLLVGVGDVDDAGVYRLTDDVALVQTVDFFTPIVDDAGDWGRIAAANALSDVYAMGGTPLTALSIVAWPRERLSFDLLGDVLDGGAEVLAKAGCTLIGGHSIDDAEPKYGLAVTGLVHPDRIVRSRGARPGDVLVLTKPIGTGLVSTAIKRDVCRPEWEEAAVRSMVALNADAAAAAREVGVHAATDVTGFGLLGHLLEMLTGDVISARVEYAAVPLLPGARDLAAEGVVPGGTHRNLDAARRDTDFGSLERADQIVLADAQTSGGLLVAVAPDRVAALLAAMEDRQVTAAVVGEVTGRAASRITVV